MADNIDNPHGPGEDVIDPAGPALGYLGIALLVVMLVFAAVMLSMGGPTR
jgi:hypothetical protein